ncbi:MAG: hypothetical protein DRR08_05250 [Candidatus Parabeggiatoa sp. nov. 2]|nr:MAG: hypothetical protein B6247_18340 [Beggiatoa sp. 4572_84]RKZ62774.1 MAG: hypothetical protein DRR08_05250 [Gammaproteobacteria bacterium]
MDSPQVKAAVPTAAVQAAVATPAVQPGQVIVVPHAATAVPRAVGQAEAPSQLTLRCTPQNVMSLALAIGERAKVIANAKAVA